MESVVFTRNHAISDLGLIELSFGLVIEMRESPTGLLVGFLVLNRLVRWWTNPAKCGRRFPICVSSSALYLFYFVMLRQSRNVACEMRHPNSSCAGVEPWQESSGCVRMYRHHSGRTISGGNLNKAGSWSPLSGSASCPTRPPSPAWPEKFPSETPGSAADRKSTRL